MTSSFLIRGCVWKGGFERGIFGRAKSCLKGIEDFDLEHWLRGRKKQSFPTHTTSISVVIVGENRPLPCFV